MLGGLWGPGIAGRIESRVRGLAGEKVPRKKRCWPRGSRWPSCLNPPESAYVRIGDRELEDRTPGFHSN